MKWVSKKSLNLEIDEKRKTGNLDKITGEKTFQLDEG